MHARSGPPPFSDQPDRVTVHSLCRKSRRSGGPPTRRQFFLASNGKLEDALTTTAKGMLGANGGGRLHKSYIHTTLDETTAEHPTGRDLGQADDGPATETRLHLLAGHAPRQLRKKIGTSTLAERTVRRVNGWSAHG